MVSLIVTIVVLIILAGVTLGISLGNNGLISKTKESVNIYEQASDTEEARLEEIMLKKLSAGDKYKDIKNEDGTAVIAKKVADGTGKMFTLPDGFYYVGGTVDSGVVISDNEADKNKYKGYTDVGKDLQGNQYVWVPVDGTNLSYAQHQYVTTAANTEGFTDTSSTADTGNGNWRTLYYRMYTDWTDSGANSESVAKYGGFYVGRYEAGFAEVEGEDSYEQATAKNITTGVPFSKAGAGVWNYINQTNAKQVAQNLNYSSVRSSLIDGTAWDTIMDWYTASGIDVNSSTNYGNYYDNRSTVPIGTIYAIHVYRGVKSGKTGTNAWFVTSKYKEAEESFTAGGGQAITTLAELQKYTNATEIDTENYSYTKRLELTAGAVEDYKIKNIYDMAGNMWEWTTEEGRHNASGSYAVLRGGSLYYAGTTYPACYRNGNSGFGDTSFHIGFRVSLYINL